jgi:TolB-like protein/Tfp pilus assembly protein PilF
VHIRILGGLEIVSLAGEPARLATRKTSLLLAALALAGEKGARREVLCEVFWPDREAAQARGSLRQALAAIRRIFPDRKHSPIRVEGDLETVQLLAGPDDIDATLFDQLVRSDRSEDLTTAADLYQGDVVAGIALPEPLDQWFAPHQREFRRKVLLLVERLSLVPDLKQVEAACQALAERLLASDPAAEEAHRALIRLNQRQGHVSAAVRQFELCKEALRRELGVEPEAQTIELMKGPPVADAGMRAAPASAPLTPPAAPARDRDQPSIIVMPFDNLSSEADEYFVDGVVEEITSALSRVREFFVIARQSAFTYKGRFADVREIGQELGVKYVVEGTVRRGGDRLRISVQLVDAATRTQLWSDRYEGVTADIFAFQDKIAAQVAGALNPAVRNAEIALARLKPPGSLRAYDLVLQAYPKLWRQAAHENSEAITLLRNAAALEPRYGRAHALLAWCHSQNVVYMWSPDPDRDRQCAREAVDATSGVIADDPTALTAVGATYSQCLADLDIAASYIENALALDPNNAWAWHRYAWVALYKEQPDQAKEAFERSLMLSPLDPLEFNLRVGMAMVMSWKGEYAQSAKMLRDVLNKHPRLTWAYRQLAFASALAGDLRTAREAVRTLRAAHPNASIALMRAVHPMRNIGGYFDEMVKGWRLAGLPEE